MDLQCVTYYKRYSDKYREYNSYTIKIQAAATINVTVTVKQEVNQ